MTEAREFVALAIAMREAQKRYFKSRSQSDLIAAKTLEKAFDQAIDQAEKSAEKPKNISGYSPVEPD